MKLLFDFDINKKKIVFFGNGFEISSSAETAENIMLAEALRRQRLNLRRLAKCLQISTATFTVEKRLDMRLVKL